jgi:single-strand DNA-binding protein
MANGDSVCNLRLAINEKFRVTSGELKEKTIFLDVTCWRKQAESVQKYCRKGDPILIEGRLDFKEWEGKDGKKNSKLFIVASRVQFLGRKHPEGDAAGKPEGGGEWSPGQGGSAGSQQGHEMTDETTPY